MRYFFLFSVAYLLFAIGLLFVLFDDLAQVMSLAIVASMAMVSSVATMAQKLIIPVVLVIGILAFVPRFRHALGDVAFAVFGTVLLQVGFSMIKSSIPVVVPFYADPVLANIDAWMHGGVDAWVWAHATDIPISAAWAEKTYTLIWTYPSILFPVLLAMFDRDGARRARYLVLYVAAWVIIGNVFAMLGSSVGPVYYDVLLGGDRFAGLAGALDNSGISQTWIGTLQAALWESHIRGGIQFGTGISAYPSMHVAVAAIFAVYLAERSLWTMPIGGGFVAVILFLSVYTGYHYAIDGYSSIIVVAIGWAILRKGWFARLWGANLAVNPAPNPA